MTDGCCGKQRSRRIGDEAGERAYGYVTMVGCGHVIINLDRRRL